jgi:hypothetical protein
VIALLATLVALACAAASARRLWFVTHATALQPDDVVAAITRSKNKITLAELRTIADGEPDAEWERDLFAALAWPNADERVALVNEQLTELDLRIQRWARVPRVCASIATSGSLFLATFVLRRAFGDPSIFEGNLGDLLTHGILGEALTVAILGIAGTLFCVGANVQAKRIAQHRSRAADRMIEKLEALANRASAAVETHAEAEAAATSGSPTAEPVDDRGEPSSPEVAEAVDARGRESS